MTCFNNFNTQLDCYTKIYLLLSATQHTNKCFSNSSPENLDSQNEMKTTFENVSKHTNCNKI